MRNNGLASLPSLMWLEALELVKDEKYNIPNDNSGFLMIFIFFISLWRLTEERNVLGLVYLSSLR